MPLDKPKRLELYPAVFHNLPLKGEGRFLVSTHEEKEGALREARRFRAFLKSLRVFPQHPTSQACQGLHCRTLVEQDKELGSWDLFVEVEDRRALERVMQGVIHGK